MRNCLLIAILFLAFISCDRTPKNAQKPHRSTAYTTAEDFGFKFKDYNVAHDTIKRGDTFGSILANQNIGKVGVYEIVNAIKDTFNVRSIRVGRPITFIRSKGRLKVLRAFIYQPDKTTYYVIDLKDGIRAFKRLRPILIRERTIAGRLDSSLSVALGEAGVDQSLASRLVKVYAWSIDFFKLQKGDEFGITFTERFLNDTVYDGVDSLKASFFDYKGKRIYAFPFEQNIGSGKLEYFDEEGKALKNFFLKAPLKFSTITSRFSSNRFHPVQHTWKAHKGTDYAAATGTPILTTATGVVEKTGYTAGNGNYVKVKHDKTYSTQYLHMSKILVRQGQHVNQGQVIGKVGSTGLATGPHVCYRFWKNGVQVDALRLKLPNSEPMSKQNLPRFMAYIRPIKNELDSIARIKYNK